MHSYYVKHKNTALAPPALVSPYHPSQTMSVQKLPRKSLLVSSPSIKSSSGQRWGPVQHGACGHEGHRAPCSGETPVPAQSSPGKPPSLPPVPAPVPPSSSPRHGTTSSPSHPSAASIHQKRYRSCRAEIRRQPRCQTRVSFTPEGMSRAGSVSFPSRDQEHRDAHAGRALESQKLAR